MPRGDTGGRYAWVDKIGHPGRRFTGTVRDFITGIRYFGQGFGMLVRRPRLLVVGMLPAVLTTALLLGGMIAMVIYIGDLSALVTPFADHWTEGWRVATRVVAGITMIGGVVLLGLVGFTALTVMIGGPFYEHIAEEIEDDLGVTGSTDVPGWKLFLLGLRDAVLMMLRSLVITIALFVAGFIPAIGQTVVPVLVMLVTAWFMALEITSVSFYRRGIDLRGRTAALRPRRMLAVGLGLPVVLLSMIPLVAIVAMPAAFAGGVLVSLDALGVARPGVALPR